MASTMRFADMSRAMRGSVPDDADVVLRRLVVEQCACALEFHALDGDSTVLCQNSDSQTAPYFLCVEVPRSNLESTIP